MLPLILLIALGCHGRSGPPDTSTTVDPTADTASVEDPAGLVAHGVVHCINPGPPGYTLLNAGADWDSYPSDVSGVGTAVGGGLAVADLDGDGRLDVVLPGRQGTRLYLQRDGLQFENVTATAFATLPLDAGERGAGVIPVDVDGDGDLDLYLTRFSRENVLALNNGDGTFADGTVSSGLAGSPDVRSVTSAWADRDGDGDLDVYVSNYGLLGVPLPAGDADVLYRNDGGVFVDVSEGLAPEVLEAHSFIAGWFDLEDDGFPELYVVEDFGWVHPNTLYWNHRGRLSLDDGSAGLAMARESMGMAMGDVNGDQRPDMLVAAWDDIQLLESSPSGVWFDHAAARGIRPDPAANRDVAWGSELADLDNDGDLDALVMYGFLQVNESNPRWQPDALFVQQADGNFEQQAEAWGLAELDKSRGLVLADLNDDGWLDVIKRDMKGPQDIFLAQCGEGAWLRVRLHGLPPNTGAVGAVVRVRAGDQSWIRWRTLGGTGFASGGPPEVHFGLGDLDQVDALEVQWPGGERVTYHGMSTRQIIDIMQQ